VRSPTWQLGAAGQPGQGCCRAPRPWATLPSQASAGAANPYTSASERAQYYIVDMMPAMMAGLPRPWQHGGERVPRPRAAWSMVTVPNPGHRMGWGNQGGQGYCLST
jgi:hypothetical protein